jgi:hypothetical protein
MHDLLEDIDKVHDAWTISAFAIVAILIVVDRLRRTGAGGAKAAENLFWPVALVICVLGLAPTFANIYLVNSTYRVRVVAVDEHDRPLSGVTVGTSTFNQTMTTEKGVAEIAIPRANMPADGRITIDASLPSAFLQGRADITLANEMNPSVRIQLRTIASTVTGLVEDGYKRALPGATVVVVGGESGETGKDGSFTLKAHAAEGQTVPLHVEKPGYKPVDLHTLAGPTPVVIPLMQDPRARPISKH